MDAVGTQVQQEMHPRPANTSLHRLVRFISGGMQGHGMHGACMWVASGQGLPQSQVAVAWAQGVSNAFTGI